MLRLALLAFSAIILGAEELPAPETKPIPSALYSKFLWADGQVLRAQMALAQMQSLRESAFAGLKAFCGEKLAPTPDPADNSKAVCK